MRQTSWILLSLVLFSGWLHAAQSLARVDGQIKSGFYKCDDTNTGFCPELSHQISYDSKYSGHDEPSLVFYSNRAGAGNNAVYHVTLPTDPILSPRQDGRGGTFNFQLHTALWFGMVLCDTQSYPNFTNTCVPDTDANIFDNPDPNAPDFIGHHPGSAFLELQFYPPGGVNTCSDPSLWCVAMVVFSLNSQPLTGKINNLDCRTQVGSEPSNFAFLTMDGLAQSAADPLNPDVDGKFGVFPGKTFQMQPGDHLTITIHDTPDGLQAVVEDVTAHMTGSMTASVVNGFAHINFDPDTDPAHPKTCSSTPYAFHPMYSTSSEHTRATWTAHTYNVSFADEIGHFEYCNAVDQEGGNCVQAGVNDPAGVDADDQQGSCFSGDFLALFGLQPIGACISQDFDFDGTSYQAKWPGTGRLLEDLFLKPSPVRFTSPKFKASGTQRFHNYSRVGFEADMPGIEFASNPECNVFTGAGCTNPPKGAAFYPIFSTGISGEGCVWQFGGPHILGTIDNFGGNSTVEFGDILPVSFVTRIDATHPNGGSITIFSDYRRILPVNPCMSFVDPDDD
ncbi:MAG: hypothetical protein DMG65_02800 [Candidatus Angelobacter sp. Gp1-AA117]|nr:MAG: hypothetical protein DMG65_02800 [Candidatus Angelobacter sp. Gp1-AA117]